MTAFIAQNLFYLLLIPLLSAIGIGCFLRRHPFMATALSVFASIAIMLLSLNILFQWDGQSIQVGLPWLSLGSLTITLGFLFDNNAAVMLAVVACIGCLIHIFSIGYMHHDSGQARYFGGLSIFMFSMLGIIFADNLIMLFIFWELVGFSSYVLIAHYYTTQEALNASKKAFITNRVGDFAFLIGIVWTYWQYGSVELSYLSMLLNTHPHMMHTAIGLLLIGGFIGKSAQFPLHVWLPDAMAGPTPVSALIHAATMVAAGIYMLVRIYCMLTPDVLNIILWLCTIMTLFAGLCALAQNDIKKILAYSTLSQLGYMGVGIGLGYPGLSMFHMATHACFKANLFLGAGAIIHALHHEQDIFNMGGLLKKMPIVAVTFFVATLALCGFYGTAGYFSKDAIIEGAYLSNKAVFFIILFSAMLTAVYMGRLLCIVFLGKPKHHTSSHASNSLSMSLPLVVLSILSVIVGYTFLWPTHWNLLFIEELAGIHQTIHTMSIAYYLKIVTISSGCIGFLVAYLLYGPHTMNDYLQTRCPVIYRLFNQALHIDKLYVLYINKVQQRIAGVLHMMDIVFLSGLIIRSGSGLVGLCSLLLRRLHTGNAQVYAYWLILGMMILCFFAFRH